MEDLMLANVIQGEDFGQVNKLLAQRLEFCGRIIITVVCFDLYIN